MKWCVILFASGNSCSFVENWFVVSFFWFQTRAPFEHLDSMINCPLIKDAPFLFLTCSIKSTTNFNNENQTFFHKYIFKRALNKRNAFWDTCGFFSCYEEPTDIKLKCIFNAQANYTSLQASIWRLTRKQESSFCSFHPRYRTKSVFVLTKRKQDLVVMVTCLYYSCYWIVKSNSAKIHGDLTTPYITLAIIKNN